MWDTPHVYLLLTTLFCRESGFVEGVTISELRVPSFVEMGSQDSVILDCVYDYQDYEKVGLVVRWYFQDDLEPFYQWIPQNVPQVVPNRVATIDVEYQVDTDDYKAHRAVKMVNLSTNLTGEYKCKVSSFENEGEQSARMIVYAPARAIDINYSRLENNLLNVSCKAEGAFPEPKLKLYQVTKSVKMPLEYKIETAVLGGVYNIHVYSLLEESAVSAEVTFVCSLSIPDTEYEEDRSISLTAGRPTTMTYEINLLGPTVMEGDHIDAPFVGIPTKNFLDENSAPCLLLNPGFLSLMSALIIMR